MAPILDRRTKFTLQIATVRVRVVFEAGTEAWGETIARSHGGYRARVDGDADVELRVFASMPEAPAGWTLEEREDLRMSLSPDRQQAIMTPHPVMPPVDSVDRALRLLVADRLPVRDGLLIHAAAARGESGITAFAGASGEGKSTVARRIGSERLVADDTLALTRTDEGWRAWSTPFMNLGVAAPAPVSAALQRILVLQKADRDEVQALRGVAAIKAVMAHVMIGPAGAEGARVLDLATRLCQEVQIARLLRTLGGDVERLLSPAW